MGKTTLYLSALLCVLSWHAQAADDEQNSQQLDPQFDQQDNDKQLQTFNQGNDQVEGRGLLVLRVQKGIEPAQAAIIAPDVN
jgi:hypothetical protein